MNKQRRKTLSQIIDLIEEIKPLVEKLKDDATNIRDQIDSEREGEQDSYDNMPESLQQGERGQDMEFAIDKLDTASQTISDLVDALDGIDLDDVISNIDEARGSA